MAYMDLAVCCPQKAIKFNNSIVVNHILAFQVRDYQLLLVKGLIKI